DVRSDQLVFFTTEEHEHAVSLVPPDNDSFASILVSDFSGAARLWYGHLQRSNDTLGTNTEGSPDRFATDWILGRQALWLVGENHPDARWSSISGVSVVNGNYDYDLPLASQVIDGRSD